ncbi:MAG: iron-sulfur cluster assembly accessory protein [Gammaproteobacteria bacterium]|nr:iron-sulfur cluster assembly accessory protein [Gammaproteobacteria bacterium]MDE0191554.1 iron-sulfur cluster assembly accessory protein [Gammaproteobacteria bacterium]
MSAEVFDPADLATITMTPSARAHVRRQLAREGADALRLGITESGCNGYMYELSYPDGDVLDGRSFRFDDVTVVVSDADWELVRGTIIDYVTEGLNSALKFKNPNATAECGCGESFSVTNT